MTGAMSAFGGRADITRMHCNVSAFDPKRTLFALPKSWNWGYSPLVRRKETNRIMGAASTTTGSIVTHEMTQDNSQ